MYGLLCIGQYLAEMQTIEYLESEGGKLMTLKFVQMKF